MQASLHQTSKKKKKKGYANAEVQQGRSGRASDQEAIF